MPLDPAALLADEASVAVKMEKAVVVVEVAAALPPPPPTTATAAMLPAIHRTTEHLEDILAKPEDILAKPEDSLAKPEDSLAKPEDILAKPVAPSLGADGSADAAVPADGISNGISNGIASGAPALPSAEQNGTHATELAVCAVDAESLLRATVSDADVAPSSGLLITTDAASAFPCQDVQQASPSDVFAPVGEAFHVTTAEHALPVGSSSKAAQMKHDEDTKTCEFCQRSGPASTFYSATKRFCSVGCCHRFSASHQRPRRVVMRSMRESNSGTRHRKESRREKERDRGSDLYRAGATPVVSASSVTSDGYDSIYGLADWSEALGEPASELDGMGIPLLPTYNVTSAVSATKKFDWATYLRETDSKAAPNYCFPERNFPESNLFQVDMKVEMACDLSQTPSNAYLMTVAQVIGMRVRLTYYGGVEGSGVFRCIDAADLFPLGWCAGNGGRIVAPPDCQLSFAQNWPDYIEQVLETAVGVPASSFPVKPEVRELLPGHKLEISLPEDGHMRYCVATVAAVSPTSVTIHLDGYEDDSAHYHSFPRNSPQLLPVGYCSGRGLKLWPPEGVTEEMFGWQSYLTFTKAEKAPEEYFRNLHNLFTAGTKLEAVDSRNPHTICVATVADVQGNNIKVHFDGWSDKFDALLRKDDETIFPVGWCAKCGLNVQPPLQKVTPGKHIRSLSSDASPMSPSAYQLGNGKRKKRLGPSDTSPPHSKRRSSTGTGSVGGKSSAPKAVFNIDCDHGPYLDARKVRSLPVEISGSSVAVVLQRVLQHLIDSSVDQRSVFDFVRSGNSTTNVHCVLANGERLIKHLQVVDRNNILWGIIKQMLSKLQCCERFITSRAMPGCTRCSTSVGNAGQYDGGLDTPGDQSYISENSWLSGSPATPHAGKRDMEGMVPLGQTYNPNRPVVSATSGSTVSLLSSITSNDPGLFSNPKIEYLATKHPKLWTVDDVRAYFECSDCASHVATLVEQEIDGNAMLLLTPDTLVRFMGLRLGPSLKICGRVDNLKSKWAGH